MSESNPFDPEDDPLAAWEAKARQQMPLSQLARAGGPRLDYLEGLNPPQREAVEALDGPVLVLAGAGSGKTRVLTARLAHLLAMGKARPYEILAVTFTNKAAREMKDRVARLVGPDAGAMPWLGTFHALSAKMLRRHAELVGLQPSFVILDADDQLRLIKQIVGAENLDDKKFPARLLAAIIDGWKNRAVTPDRVPAADKSAFGGHGPRLYAEYQERLKTLNAADFGDLLLHMLRVFRENPDVLEDWRARFKYILVDEYQDANVAQYLWLRLLAGARRNICVVGDDDQSIYGWRGAEIGAILGFEKDFPGAKVIRLEENYRSTPEILAAAAGVISGNTERLGKTLWTKNGSGAKVRLMGLYDGDEEARWVGEEIEALQKGLGRRPKMSLDAMAILVRATHQMRAFEERFLAIGLPYRVIGGPRFYERQEIRDAIAYLRLVAQPDDGLAFERIVNTPRRGLGDKALQTIQIEARAANVSPPMAAFRLADSGAIGGRAGTALRGFFTQLAGWRRKMTEVSPADLAGYILDDSGYTAMWKAEKSPDAAGRLENLKELVRGMNDYETIPAFLEHVSLVMEAAREGDGAGERVSVMTLHAAKGLEYDAVFLPGWEEGLFPSQRAMDEQGRKGLEEERRLAYVGITRARKLLSISFASSRRVYNQWQSATPSRFIDDMPRAAVEILTPPGLYNGGFGAGRKRGYDVTDVEPSPMERRASAVEPQASPGWRRMIENKAAARASPPEGGMRILSVTMAGAASARARKTASAFSAGQRVFHEKFGYGVVKAVESDTLLVRFEKSDEKRVKAGFVKPADDIPF